MKEYKELYRIKVVWRVIGCPILIFFGFIVLSACTKEERPENVLSKEEMVKVLGELYVMEERVNKLGIGRDSALLVFDYFNDEVFKKLGTTDSAFKRSMNYYMDRPQEIEKIYAALIDSLNLQEQRLSIPK